MARIKVTGYINTESMNPDEVDLSHETGLTDEGFETLHASFNDIVSVDDLEFTLEP